MEDIALHRNINSLQKRKTLLNSLRTYSGLIGLEAFFWISGLIYLAFFSPLDKTHFTICPLANAGFEYCPGCGLGHSITQFFHGNFLQSFSTHPLGIFALIVISYRIFTLIKKNIINYKKAKA